MNADNSPAPYRDAKKSAQSFGFAQDKSVDDPSQINFGHLRRLTPISRSFGFDRGQPVDRHYIERFLSRHAADIHGRVLEIGEDHYTRRFGRDRVQQADVLDLPQRNNPHATIAADLTGAGHVPSALFDCIIFTQTLQFIYDVQAAVATLHRLLKSGGVLLATFPAISQICRFDMDRWGDYWRFTDAAIRRLLGDTFGYNRVDVTAHGNVLVAVSFLHGLSAHELDPAEPDDQFKVTCLCPYESEVTVALRQMGCDVFVTFMAEDPLWRSIQSTVEIIRHQHIDVIHAHLPKAHTLAGLAGAITQTPVVATLHGMEITTEDLGISRTTGSHLVVVCQEARNQALALGVPPQGVTLIPNGVDLEKYTPTATRDNLRSAFNVPPQAPLVGFVGRLDWVKGPDQFVRAAKVVHNKRPDAHFVLVGQGPMESELASLIGDTGLGDCVHMAGLRTDTWNVYPALDVLVQTSRVEGMPLVLLEAMACGCPVVAMGVGGVLELIEVSTTGLLSAPGDWEGIGNALLMLLANPAQMKQMGRAARRRAETLFDLQNSVRLTGELLCRLAGSRPRQRAGRVARRAPANGAR